MMRMREVELQFKRIFKRRNALSYTIIGQEAIPVYIFKFEKKIKFLVLMFLLLFSKGVFKKYDMSFLVKRLVVLWVSEDRCI